MNNVIEVLYSDICNLYGDNGNILLLEKYFGKDKIIYTGINDEPYFVNHRVKLIYLASMSENTEKIVINKLMPFKAKLEELIANNVHILLTGNALNVFSHKIIDKEEILGLGIIKVDVKRSMKKRINCHYAGIFKKFKVLGFKSQFTLNYSKDKKFLNTVLGFGNNYEDKNEGVKINNLYATNLLGPILVINPYFTKYLFEEMGYTKKLPHEKELIEAYDVRLKEYELLESESCK